MASEAIPVLRVTDAVRAVAWYERLGFSQEWEHRFGPSFPAFVSIVRDGSARVFLAEHEGDAKPDGLLYLRVPSVKVVADELSAAVVDQPWGEEVHLTDPDGNRVRVGTATA